MILVSLEFLFFFFTFLVAAARSELSELAIERSNTSPPDVCLGLLTQSKHCVKYLQVVLGHVTVADVTAL